MKTSSLSNPAHIDRFLRTLKIQSGTVSTYTCFLREFQRSMPQTVAGHAPSMRALCCWMRQLEKRSPLYMVHSRARLVDRFMAWLNKGALLDCNPFEQWRQKYHLHSMTPIVEALLSKQPEQTLLQLQGYARFGSFLGPQIHAHVARMRVLGCRYDTAEAALLRFDRFLQRRPNLKDLPLKALVAAWSQTRSQLRSRLEAQQCGRWLSQSMHRLDPTVPVLSIEVGLKRRVIQGERRPHIYSETQICQLMEAAKTFPSPLAPLRPQSLYTMVVLGYCLGLRIGEIVRLTLADIDLDNATLEIRDTKFFKSRRLPLSASVLKTLKQYLTARAANGAPRTPQSGLFYCRRGGAYSYGSVELCLSQVIRRAKLEPTFAHRGPRVHDLRHTFVVHRMLDWYRNGINPQTRLPHLATYLGHKDIASTLIYMNFTPELLQQASQRLHHFGAAVLGGVEESA